MAPSYSRVLAGSAALSGVSGKAYFADTLNSLDGWVHSDLKSDMGKFELKAGEIHLDEEEDKGLMTTEDSRFYGISKEIEEPFSNEDVKELYVQYQVKYDKDLECGGGYLKVGPKVEDLTKFGDPTPYNIMFGPDKCGGSKRTHLIFNYDGKNLLKKEDLPYKQDQMKVSTLYRLVLRSDNTVRVEINQEEVFDGKLMDAWDFGLPAKEMNDPEDTKPEDWVRRRSPVTGIDDPEDTKPEDWVENAMMDDPEDTMPEGYVDEPEIADPEAKEPEDWDSEEDGAWEAPKIANSQYPWQPKKIENPEYKGEFKPKQIPNPDYVEGQEDKLYLYESFGFLGFDLWQVKAGAHFDNVMMSDDKQEADNFAEKWKTVHEYEKEQLETKKEEPASTADKTSDGDALDSIDADDDGLDDDQADL